VYSWIGQVFGPENAAITHRLDAELLSPPETEVAALDLRHAGYSPVRNDSAVDGLWKLGSKRQTIYARKELSVRDRIVAATTLCREAGQ
jgi:hypothetical protein